MRRLGVIGGVTWHSTHKLYAMLNEGVSAALGPLRSADLVLRSLDYGRVRECQTSGNWKGLQTDVVRAAVDCQRAGAEALMLASNSLHAMAERAQTTTGLPVIHIADALVEEAQTRGLQRLGFFGTAFTMRSGFVLDRLTAAGLDVVLPSDRTEVDRVIMEELALGVVRESSRAFYLEQLAELQVDAFVSGCTEIGALVGPEHVEIPHLDTLNLHAAAAVRWLVADQPS